jgi:hypothetical protein
MAIADKKDSTNWTPLQRAASTDEGRRLLTDDLLNDRYPVRYQEASTDERGHLGEALATGRCLVRSVGDHHLLFVAGHEQLLSVREWRVGRLPEHFVRLGKFNWEWGFLTHDGRVLHSIEIQFPKDETAAVIDAATAAAPPPAADQTAVAYRGPGRESLKDKIQTAAWNIPAEKRPKTKTAWAKMVADQLKVGFSTAKEWVYPLWDEK